VTKGDMRICRHFIDAASVSLQLRMVQRRSIRLAQKSALEFRAEMRGLTLWLAARALRQRPHDHGTTFRCPVEQSYDFEVGTVTADYGASRLQRT
jgi:hypothetical protein